MAVWVCDVINGWVFASFIVRFLLTLMDRVRSTGILEYPLLLFIPYLFIVFSAWS
jgi:hypothetical protein